MLSPSYSVARSKLQNYTNLLRKCKSVREESWSYFKRFANNSCDEIKKAISSFAKYTETRVFSIV